MVWQTVEKILDISRKKINGLSFVECAKFYICTMKIYILPQTCPARLKIIKISMMQINRYMKRGNQ
jgi:hypothetical protein